MRPNLLKLAVFAACYVFAGKAGAAHPWEEMTRQDLQAIRAVIEANHPGPVDTENPQFAAWFDAGHAVALEKADEVRTFGGYKHVLRSYINGFQDAHLSLRFEISADRAIWPGFLLEWRDGTLVAGEGAGVPAGARLVSCDGSTAEELLEEWVFRWRGNRDLPAHHYLHAPYVLADFRNPFVSRPQSCSFDVGGTEHEVELGWRYIATEELREKIELSARVTGLQAGVYRFADSGSWISFPSFSPGGETAEAMREVIERLPSFRDSEFIVVDLRGNVGGSSWWTNDFLSALYGEAYMRDIMAAVRNADEFEEHRVSAANLAHWERVLPYIEAENGADSEVARYARKVVTGLRRGIEAGETWYREVPEAPDASTDNVAEPAWQGRLYVLTDAACVSACLDFMDAALALPGTVHVGLPTSADTLYMEVRGENLPGGNARLFHATKVIRNRMRGHNEYYSPAHPWQGDIRDTAALQEWISQLHAAGG